MPEPEAARQSGGPAGPLVSLLRWLLFLAILGGLVFATPALTDRLLNRVETPGPYAFSEEAKGLLASTTVVDLHADPLLWGRDLLQRHAHGQVDLPRLVEGQVGLQVFGIVTQTPRSMNFESTPADDLDAITLMALAQRWPVATWSSRRARAIHQAEQLARAAADSEDQLRVLRSGADLDSLVAARREGSNAVGGLLALEGMHALDGDLSSIDTLFEAGLRMMAPTHFFDNRIGGSAAGVEKYGLTDLGRQAIQRMEELGIAIDLAHASPRTIRDIFAIATTPLVVSHTGVQATCPGPRNLSDEEIRGVAASGGVIGVGYFHGAVCGTRPAAIARAMNHVRKLVGPEHVALGSDFDGAVTTGFDTTGLGLIVDALLEEGFSRKEIRLALGANSIRVLRRTLP